MTRPVLLDHLLCLVGRGDQVTATFLVTHPAPPAVRAQLYVAGVDFDDDRVAPFEWVFRVRGPRAAWERFVALTTTPLEQLQVAAL